MMSGFELGGLRVLSTPVTIPSHSKTGAIQRRAAGGSRRRRHVELSLASASVLISLPDTKSGGAVTHVQEAPFLVLPAQHPDPVTQPTVIGDNSPSTVPKQGISPVMGQ